MATLEIPVRNDLPAYQFTLELDGLVYSFTFTFNDRMGKWIMDIGDEQGDPIVQGLPVFADWPLLDRFKDTRLPPGLLIFVDTTGNKVDPTREDFGDRVVGMYIEEADL